MFDEVDEGTAMYKFTDKGPSGKHFVNFEKNGVGLVPQPDLGGNTRHSAKIPEMIRFPKG